MKIYRIRNFAKRCVIRFNSYRNHNDRNTWIRQWHMPVGIAVLFDVFPLVRWVMRLELRDRWRWWDSEPRLCWDLCIHTRRWLDWWFLRNRFDVCNLPIFEIKNWGPKDIARSRDFLLVWPNMYDLLIRANAWRTLRFGGRSHNCSVTVN